jgi:hypothetical protein
MSFEETEKALEEGIFNRDVRETARMEADQIISPPIWLQVIAGGNIMVPHLVINLARDVKSWEEGDKNGNTILL